MHEKEYAPAPKGAGGAVCQLGGDISANSNLPIKTQFPQRSSWSGSYQLKARRCLYSVVNWTSDEAQFLRQMVTQYSKPTDQQQMYLQELCNRAQHLEKEIGFALS